MSEMSIYSTRGLGSFALCKLVNCIFLTVFICTGSQLYTAAGLYGHCCYPSPPHLLLLSHENQPGGSSFSREIRSSPIHCILSLESEPVLLQQARIPPPVFPPENKVLYFHAFICELQVVLITTLSPRVFSGCCLPVSGMII